MKAIVLAAGLGSRLKPLTDRIPKALVPVGGKPLLQIQIERLAAAGYTEVVVNVHHLANQLEAWCKAYASPIPIRISDEREELLDTGGAIRHAQEWLSGGRFLIHNVDILSNADLHQFYAQGEGRAATLMVSHRQTNRYLLFNPDMRLVGWTNTDTGEVRTPFPNLNPNHCQRLAFAGIHQMDPSLFAEFHSQSARFSIIHFYLSLCRQYPIYGYSQPHLALLDVGKQQTLAQAEAFYRKYQGDL